MRFLEFKSKVAVAFLALVALAAGPAASALASETEFPVPTSGSVPTAITRGPDGALWFTELDGSRVGRITTGGVVSEFPIGTSSPTGIATGSDGALWVADHQGSIDRVTTAGSMQAFSVPSGRLPWGIVAGPDGNLWATVQAPSAGGGLTSSAIAQIKTDGTITEYETSGAVQNIVSGPDGALWFTDPNGAIGRITTTGVITEFPVGASSIPYGITTGPDGALWFTDQSHGQVGRVTTAGVVKEFPVGASSLVDGIAAGPDGALWVADYAGKSIWKVTTAGTGTEYKLPSQSSPRQILAGPDGALWFTIYQDKIGRITTAGISAPVQCVVPNVMRKTLAKAKRLIVAAHCQVGRITRVRRHGRPGVVFAQRPAPGRKLAAGHKVDLKVSHR
jgi:virginiamycin B lyase